METREGGLQIVLLVIKERGPRPSYPMKTNRVKDEEQCECWLHEEMESCIEVTYVAFILYNLCTCLFTVLLVSESSASCVLPGL